MVMMDNDCKQFNQHSFTQFKKEVTTYLQNGNDFLHCTVDQIPLFSQ